MYLFRINLRKKNSTIGRYKI